MGDIVSQNQKITKIACNTCTHFDFDNLEGYSCAAFVNIPKDILLGNDMHLKPLKGQGNNIVYMKIKE